MTYCVAVKLNAGLVFLSDSRTNAGLDQISTFRKMIVYEKPGDRFMCLLSAGNLSVSQSVREILQVEQLEDVDGGEPITIWNAKSMFDAARVLGSAVRHVYERDGESLKRAGVDFNVSMIFGGQIKGEGMRLFQVYSAGNFIEATAETPFFQVGESKYGKPVYAVAEDSMTSGAYLIALAADEIYANSSSLVGSIGVVASSFGFIDLMDKVGVERRLYTSGQSKGMLDPFSPESPESRKQMLSTLSNVHTNFIAAVIQNRAGKLNPAEEQIFDGRFWDGQTAMNSNAFFKSHELHRNLTLIVVHGQNCIKFFVFDGTNSNFNW